MPVQIQEQVKQDTGHAPTQNLDLLSQQQAALSEEKPKISTISSEDLGLVPPSAITKLVKAKKVDAELKRQADDFTTQLLSIKVGDAEAEEGGRVSVENIGTNVVRKATAANELLKQPLVRLGQIGGGEGQEIANQLTDLKIQFDEIDPSRFNFEPGWVGRTVSKLPFVGKPMNRYFTRFQSSGSVIDSLFDSLEVSKGQLLRDITALREDQVEMRTATKRLQRLVATCELIDENLSARVDTLDAASDEAKYINTKLVHPLQQRITDLQQQLIVNQQGIMVFEVLIENNKELIRGVNRCKNVTYPALLIGITAAQALANQRIVLNKINALNEVGNRAITFNGQLLKTTGVEIHKLSASAQLSDAGLARAMTDAIQALDDISTFRMKAIEQMRAAIRERDGLTATGEKAIRDMERGREAIATLDLDRELEPTGPKNK